MIEPLNFWQELFATVWWIFIILVVVWLFTYDGRKAERVAKERDIKEQQELEEEERKRRARINRLAKSKLISDAKKNVN